MDGKVEAVPTDGVIWEEQTFIPVKLIHIVFLLPYKYAIWMTLLNLDFQLGGVAAERCYEGLTTAVWDLLTGYVKAFLHA